MAASKFLNLLAISSLAILATFGPTQTVALETAGHQHVARSNVHSGMTKRRKRQNSRRCQNRPVSSPVQVPGDAATPAPEPAKVEPPKEQQPPQQPPAQQQPPSQPQPPAQPPSQPQPPTGNMGGKIGLAWNNPSWMNICDFATSRTGYVYTWSPFKISGSENCGLKTAPMLWGHKQVGDFDRLVQAGYSDVALAFNEPDQDGQSNMSPGDAVGLWWGHMQPLKSKGYRLGSPATTNSPAGVQWMRDFFSQCNGCSVDFVAVHWYGTSVDEFIKHVTMIHDTFGRNIWITEYACQNFGGGAQCSKDQIYAFTSRAIEFINNTPWIEQAMPFGFLSDMYNVNYDNQLVSGNKPNDLGRMYIGY